MSITVTGLDAYQANLARIKHNMTVGMRPGPSRAGGGRRPPSSVPAGRPRGGVAKGLPTVVAAGGAYHKDYVVGPDLDLAPYATHWIEEGYRDDPRFSQRVHINYRQPSGAYYMRETARALNSYVHVNPPDVIGVPLSGYVDGLARRAVAMMRARLQSIVYTPPPYNARTGRTWERRRVLIDSVEAREV